MAGHETRTEARRRVYRRRRLVVGGGLVLCSALLVLAGFRLAAAVSSGDVNASVTAQSSSAPTTAAKARSGSTATPAKSARSPSPSPVQTAAVRSTGEYLRAPGGTARHGSGTPLTYRVEVETGTGQGLATFAGTVDETLANSASWTGQGRWSLQRTSSNKADFVIRLATPATVDKACAKVGLDTRGYVSCQASEFVMINLDRWLEAVPDYHGDVALYRRYVINHEVGHQLGYSHQACPGPGRLAPVMQQQTSGLEGCLPNGWPYVAGKFVSGPPAP